MSEKYENQGTPQTTITSTASASSLPPPEKPSAIRTRFKVVAAFWAVILFLGFPIWWKTTSIYRAELPLQEMLDWAGGKSCRPVLPVEIEFETPSLSDVEAQQLLRTTQHTLDDLNEFSAHHLRLKLADEEAQQITEKADTALTVRLLAQNDLPSPRSELQTDTTTLDVFYPPSQIPLPSSANSPLSSFIAGELQRLFAEEKATIAQILSNSAIGAAASSNNQAQQISPQLAESITKRLRRSMKYAETYHLAFSLFTPGSAPSSWDIESAVQEYISPVVQALSPISNFTIDTQVQLYATFSPTTPAPEYDEAQGIWTLQEENLSAFINAAEWPLNPSIGAGPTINFILYVPSPDHFPLLVKESKATSWIIPQWGGVFILNPPLPTRPDTNSTKSLSNPPHLPRTSLRPAFLTFSHQLLSLLGTPSTPASLPLRLQTLIRIRAATLLLSASSTLGSLARLTESLPSIPIPAPVSSSVSTTLSHLSASCESLRNGRFRDALASARVAETEAERSFFEKSMVGQVYFPDEHKVAVYLPLLGPIGVPLVLGLLKEVRRIIIGWKGARSG
ncbi:phosphatidylinositol-glycan biosynthesis class S protein [Aspergillus pseudoustus]|uniref:Phosphatidylinositol-glycan biosynthesis class S protein n=1 Tax=Aspergillus pseudoustus TaxID=1810923 RepID=A0ABR4K0U7_9EURO